MAEIKVVSQAVNNQSYSTLMGIMCMLVVTKVLLQQAPELMVHKRLVYELTAGQVYVQSALGVMFE